jgi:chromosome segregation ATPase
MGVLSFLTASKLKSEIVRQRDEIARMHQVKDAEAALKQEADNKLGDAEGKSQALERANAERASRIKELERSLEKARENSKKSLSEELKKVQEKSEKDLHDMDVRLATLRQELDDKQRQRAEVTEQNSVLAEKSSQLEATVAELTRSVKDGLDQIRLLEEDKHGLQTDLDKIMGNLTKW